MLKGKWEVERFDCISGVELSSLVEVPNVDGKLILLGLSGRTTFGSLDDCIDVLRVLFREWWLEDEGDITTFIESLLLEPCPMCGCNLSEAVTVSVDRESALGIHLLISAKQYHISEYWAKKRFSHHYIFNFNQVFRIT